MILSGFIDRVRDIVATSRSSGSSEHAVSDADIIRYMEDHVASLSRKMADANVGWFNVTFHLPASAFREVYKGRFEAPLPRWVMQIVAVHRVAFSGGDEEHSPYTISSPPSLGVEIPHDPARSLRQGWAWSGDTKIEMCGGGKAEPVSIRAARRPARVFRAVIGEVHPGASSMYLPGSLELGSEDYGGNAYSGAHVQVSGLSGSGSAARDLLGAVRMCVGSTQNGTSAGGSRVTELRFDAEWPGGLQVGDTVETVVPIPDEHARYLVLLTARSIFQRRNNIAGLKATADDLGRERDMFLQGIRPRQRQSPGVVRGRTYSYPGRGGSDLARNWSGRWH